MPKPEKKLSLWFRGKPEVPRNSNAVSMKSPITSTQNPTIKNLLLLREKARERKKQHLFLVEGIREIQLAIEAGYQIPMLLFCPEIIHSPSIHAFIDTLNSGTHDNTATSYPADNGGDRSGNPLFELFLKGQTEFLEVSRNVFNRLALRQDGGGMLACAKPKPYQLDHLKLPDIPLVLVLESVEKPGNLGAILRTADAAGVDAVIVCDPGTDLCNPNTIRASLGSFFTNQLALASSEACIQWLSHQGMVTFGAALTGELSYDRADYTTPAAIIMGSEAWGLSDQWLKACDKLIKIPMFGKVDSMNVSASTAVLVFEAVRQRCNLTPGS